MHLGEVAEIYARGFLEGRKDGNAKSKAIDAAVLYAHPRTEAEEVYIRSYLHRRLPMKKIALEGPINGCSDSECQDWRDAVIACLGKGYTFHNPMDFDCRGREVELETELVSFDEAGIASSDILLVMAHTPGWGTAMAVQMGFAQGKYILTICPHDRVSPWLNNRSSKVVKSLDEALEVLRNL